MAEEKKDYQLGKQVLTEQDIRIPIEYKGEIFTLQYPNPYQRTLIESEIARHLGGVARENYPLDHVTTVCACAYINSIIVQDESPKWFTSAWTCLDEELIGTLYGGYLRFRDELQGKIKKDGFARGSEGGSS